MKHKYIIISLMLLLLILLFINGLSAERIPGETLIEFQPTNFIFVYSDHNSTTYEGDLGLDYAVCTNQVDKIKYSIVPRYVRALDKVTNGTFKLNNTIDIIHGVPQTGKNYQYPVTGMYYKNGTEIKSLDISDDLTYEDRQYFQDYDGQKEEYYQKQVQDELDAIESQERIQTRQNSHRSGWYYGRGGFGYYSSF